MDRFDTFLGKSHMLDKIDRALDVHVEIAIGIRHEVGDREHERPAAYSLKCARLKRVFGSLVPVSLTMSGMLRSFCGSVW
ncbi:MAG: hypothetical protein M0Z84_14510 [Gammaproteobacteria bacterium]|nr:hypothetical protein [Gammaproteobacteria bacterium]